MWPVCRLLCPMPKKGAEGRFSVFKGIPAIGGPLDLASETGIGCRVAQYDAAEDAESEAAMLGGLHDMAMSLKGEHS